MNDKERDELLIRMDERTASMNDHIKSVSGKADKVREELKTHVDSLEAHGAGANKRADEGRYGLVGMAVSLTGMAYMIWKNR